MRFEATLVIKWLVALGASGHIAYLTVGLFTGHLGANPIEAITHQTGEWGFNFLLATLSITPIKKIFHWGKAIKLRRNLGLWSFAYLFLHFFTYIFFDHFFNLQTIWIDIIDRPYITAGFAGLLLMIPLAITSLKYFLRKMGKNWLTLHKAIYPIGILGLVHYWWLTKADFLKPSIYLIILIFLLGIRIYWSYKKNKRHYVKNIA